jgi:crotonobetaine/carnitine-CoA ligase
VTLELKEKSIARLLEKNAAEIGHKPAIHFIQEQLTLTYSQLNERVNQFANVFYDSGIGKDDHVAVMLPNCPEFPITWLALSKIGAVMIPVNTRYQSDDLEYVLRDSDSSALIIHQDFINIYRSIEKRVDEVEHIFRIGNAEGTTGQLLKEMADVAPKEFSLADTGITDLINIQYTSGTTGFPKGCMLSNEYWLTIGYFASRYLRKDDVFLSVSPFYYMDAQWELISCFTTGCSMVLGLKYSASNFFKTVVQHKVTAAWATMAPWLYKQKKTEFDTGHSLRFVWVGELPAHLHAPFEKRFNVRAREVYGSTEIGLATFVDLEEANMVGSGSIGKPPKERKVKIVDENGVRVPTGEVGTLLIAGPGMFKGYYEKPEETEKVFKDGWFDTGDLSRQDNNGNYYIVGRKKDMIRKSGDNISAYEIESLLRGHPKINDAAVVPVPDVSRGEEVKAYIIPTEGYTPEDIPPEEIITFCSGKIAEFKVPRYIEYRKEFPMTPSQRPLKYKLIQEKVDLTLDCYDRLSPTGTEC